MDVVRKIFLWISGILLGPMLLLVVAVWGFNQTIGSPDYTKQVFREVRVYDEITDYILDEIKNQTSEGAEGELFNQVIADTVTPNRLEGVIVKGVDVAYEILKGDTDPADFDVDISQVTNELINNTRARLKERLLKLNPCNFANPPNSINPFEFDCLPFGDDVDAYVDMALMAAKLDNDLLRSGSLDINTLLADSTGDDLKETKEEIEQNLQTIRNISTFYQALQSVYWAALVIVLISIVLIIFLSKQAIKGVKRVGLIVMSNGILIAAIGGVTTFSVDRIVADLDARDDPTDTFQLVGNVIIGDYGEVVMKFGIVLMLVGGAAALAAHTIWRKQHPKQSDDEQKDEVTASKNQVENKEKQEKKPAKKQKPKPASKKKPTSSKK